MYVEKTFLESIVEKTAGAIEDSKKEIFDFSEKMRIDFSTYEQEILYIKSKLVLVIDEVDCLESRFKQTKEIIKIINEDSESFSIEDIREAYCLSERTLIQLTEKRREEKMLKERRNELEQLMRYTKDILKTSETLEMKISVALDYLSSDVEAYCMDLKPKSNMGLEFLKSQENEKKRISRDMHDGPAQTLANIILKAEFVEQIIDLSPEKAKMELRSLKDDVRGSLSDIRKIIYDLMPMSLEDLGLIATVNKLIKNVKSHNGIDVHFTFTEEAPIVSTMVQLMVFRVIQEALNNIAKHAKVHEAKLNIFIDQEKINVLIQDYGVGFDCHDLNENDNSFGMNNMRERIEIIDGHFEIHSNLNKGTRIKLVVPNTNR